MKKPIHKVENHPYPQTTRPMSKEEKKEFNKEKLRRKKEYLSAKRKKHRR